VPAAERSQAVSVWLPIAQVDRLCALARRHDVSLSGAARLAIRKLLREDEPREK
jgi:hypothetical protein